MGKPALEPVEALPAYDDVAEPSSPASETDSVTTSPVDLSTEDSEVPDTTAPPAAAEDEPPATIPWDILLAHTLPTCTYHHSNPDDDFVPTYTETDESPILTLLSSHPHLSTLLALPLTTYPAPLGPTWSPPYDHPTPSTNPLATNPTLTDEERAALYNLQTQIITTFFHAITTKNTALVTTLTSQGLVSPDTPSATGTTPLLAAIDAGSGAMVCHLVALGARPNAYGTTPAGHERTPLMAAAARGNLALVKLLVEDFAADDAVIAPDGQLALRLAADAGHRDVVAYLPARRGGAWRRWKVQHAVAWGRVCRAFGKVVGFCKFFGWTVPRFFVWSVPKHLVVKPVWKACKYSWDNRRRFGGWCGRQAKEFPGRVARAGKAVWRGAKKVPVGVWKVAKEVPAGAWKVAKAVPKVVGGLVKWLWKVVRAIPGVMKLVCLWIWDSLKQMGQAVGHVFLRVVAALHTAVAAVLGFFRSIKLRDVWNGFCEVVDAVVRGLPRAIWKVVSTFGIVVAGTIVALFGCAGKVLLLLVQGLWYVARYVPMQLGEMIAGIWSSIAKGYHEILVWINPKH